MIQNRRPLPSSRFAMRRNPLGRLLFRFYRFLPAKRLVLKLAFVLEGGQMYSLSARDILSKHHGVIVGNYSYGSLLELGMSDKYTRIGSYTSAGPNVRRIGAAHPLDHLMLHPFWYNPSLGMVSASNDVPRTPCEIGSDVWIGANVTILPGCTSIGNGAVVGAGAIVTVDVPPYSIVAGVPARVIGTRLTPADRQRLSRITDWSAGPLTINGQIGDVHTST